MLREIHWLHMPRSLLKSSAATKTMSVGGVGQNFFLGVQNFWVGLLFSEFSVDLKKKKKKVIVPIWSYFLRVLC